MYQLTKQKNKILDIDNNKLIYKSSVEWKEYTKWLREGNMPLSIDDDIIYIKPSISADQWDELELCKTIASVKNWLYTTLK